MAHTFIALTSDSISLIYLYCCVFILRLGVQRGTDCVVCVLVVFLYLLFVTLPYVSNENPLYCTPILFSLSHPCYQKVVPHCCLISFTVFISRFWLIYGTVVSVPPICTDVWVINHLCLPALISLTPGVLYFAPGVWARVMVCIV